MSTWKLRTIGSHRFKDPILIEGLPGIGNVGKVAADFLVDELEAKRVATLTSNSFPHSVFVNEQNLVEMPLIEIYHKKLNKKDILLLVGDVQPIDEESCYSFCKEVLNLFNSYGGKEIITIGGIGLQDIPKKPKVYCTGNTKKVIQKYTKGTGVINKLYGVVGPIVGVSGLLVGLAKDSKVDAICLLAETYGHPMYLGIKGAREVLNIITKKLQFQLNLKELDKEIDEIEKGFIKSNELANVGKTGLKVPGQIGEDVNYIG
ncbi:MAG: PAC2 family protein, partial [Candidatus Woesearchaeota archaeon]|jgi:hypothetical protein|nr:PAC2 family protein [Candidatus Woesearchaeota archaeon]